MPPFAWPGNFFYFWFVAALARKFHFATYTAWGRRMKKEIDSWAALIKSKSIYFQFNSFFSQAQQLADDMTNRKTNEKESWCHMLIISFASARWHNTERCEIIKTFFSNFNTQSFKLNLMPESAHGVLFPRIFQISTFFYEFYFYQSKTPSDDDASHVWKPNWSCW